jgi:hypothetical protein
MDMTSIRGINSRRGHMMVSTASLSFFERRSSFTFFLSERIIERLIQYIKDRTTECFDNYFPCKRKKCKLKHVKNWLKLFVDFHNKEITLK